MRRSFSTLAPTLGGDRATPSRTAVPWGPPRRRGCRTWALVAVVSSLGLHPLHAASPGDAIVTFADGRVPSREVFVGVEGNDTEGDGSRQRPFRTLSRAAHALRPGTALRLLPGTYSGGQALRDLAGTAEAPVWIGGIPGEPRPVLQGGSAALQLSRVRHLVLEHLEVARCTANGINIDDGGAYADPEASRFLVLRHLALHDIGTGGNQDCLKLSGINDFWVLDSDFARGSAGGSGIDQVGCHRGLIARCRFEAMGGNAIQAKGGSEDIEIRGCRFLNAGQRAINLGGSTGFAFFRPPLSRSETNVEARNLRVVANVFVGSDAPVAFVGCLDVLVANNTIIDPARWVARILQETVSAQGYTFAPSGRSRFVNNLVSFRRHQLRDVINVGGGTDPQSFVFAHNLWHARDVPDRSRPTLPSPESHGIVGQDPLLADPVTGDPAIPADSPAAGAGQPLPEVTMDLRGHFYGNPPAIGAWEPSPTARDEPPHGSRGVTTR